MMIALIAKIIFSSFPEPSTVITNEANECIFWFYDYEPEKHNPCGIDDEYVPENATPMELKDD